ncbi:homoserine dehydrogenase [Reyranella sp.]|jgi:homoserine dehydrogenase|uniref:homoserine dehydrogenase n=1 Tax=Reyranella sp. TaxID=1929291 RepID=UPI000BD849DC|nr:homoserine dehydrogenase [Reyranella sp.]OYY44162.1 MAG: homoserine dehydrogenase [Rhodospirillales bacterium 35-66-84]OYZ94838.1 MAG: homoserine dehydrogenase [Rhodospirillales bacterium 24-66-33]OZB26087.1 MAG: homoserine dehydrogenase [Rhodospirillales bacterium 39-66-50]HQS15216.1 homoserine dehydrogenase [Reyranella sp.]HQT11025.1 homoserine dehydrogenase [Reyranella sp.]
MKSPLRIGIAGLGTVGAGVVKLLAEHGRLLALRGGRPLKIVAVSARSKAKKRDIDLSGLRWEKDPMALATAPDIDVVVELIGGSGGVARRLVQKALASGKHVVTANKALLAMHGAELAAAAEKKQSILAFEAAVAGGIPIIKALREGLVGNRVKRLYGILNGTCNYILTTMRETGRDFNVVLAEAQAAGYAEADPTFDVDGIDAAHKLAVLTGAAFGARVDFAGVHVEGIRRVTSMDIQFAEELGYRIKLLGLARETRHGIEQRVHPCMVPLDTPIAHIEGVFNAVVVEGDFVGTTMFQGRGAGQGPTASAVVADLVDVARGRHMPAFVVPADRLATKKASPIDRHVGAYYIRLMVQDRPGVIAAVSGALAKERISLESMLQRGRSESGEVPVVLTTHETEEAAMRRALARIAKLGAVAEEPCVIRIEKF